MIRGRVQLHYIAHYPRVFKWPSSIILYVLLYCIAGAARNPHSPDDDIDTEARPGPYNIYLFLVVVVVIYDIPLTHTHAHTNILLFLPPTIICGPERRRRHRRGRLASLFWPARWRFKRKIRTWFMIEKLSSRSHPSRDRPRGRVTISRLQ